jgi:hypothetical protein
MSMLHYLWSAEIEADIQYESKIRINSTYFIYSYISGVFNNSFTEKVGSNNNVSELYSRDIQFESLPAYQL